MDGAKYIGNIDIPNKLVRQFRESACGSLDRAVENSAQIKRELMALALEEFKKMVLQTYAPSAEQFDRNIGGYPISP